MMFLYEGRARARGGGEGCARRGGCARGGMRAGGCARGAAQASSAQLGHHLGSASINLERTDLLNLDSHPGW